MKQTRKTTRRSTRSRIDPEAEENIFNPFAPLMRCLRRRGKKQRRMSDHPFRDTFITVVLVHVIGILGFLAFGAFKDSTKSSAANKAAAKNQKASQVANMLQTDQPQLIRHEGADSGGKLLAMRQPSPIEENDMTGGEVASENPVKDSRIKPAAKSRPPQSGESQAAAVEAPRREPGTRQSEAVAPESSEALKSAFLAATGRAKPATDTQIEDRQTQAVEQVTPRAHAAPPMETPIRRAQAAYAGVAEYTVGRGDNAHLISSRLGVSYAELAAANNLASPRDLRVGQKLVVPREQGGSM